MALFMSTFVNKVDAKGRVSVPAAFRNALAPSNFPGLVVFRSFKVDAIEGRTYDHMEEMAAQLETLEQFSDEYDSLATLFADAQQLTFDGEGRVMLPPELRDFARIDGSAAFVGLGNTFQIWEPGAFDLAREANRQKSRANNFTLPPRQPPNRAMPT